MTLTEPAVEALGGSSADAFLQVAKAGDYVALLAYLPSDDPQWENALQTFRQAIATKSAKATSVGFGPRYLHSTGQLHKGGAQNGVFIIITADATEDLAIPEAPYSFGVLETAQALGDFQSLDRTGRRGCSFDCQSETSISSRKSRSSWSKSCSDRPRKDYRATRATIAVTLSVAPLFIADRTTFCATSSTAF